MPSWRKLVLLSNSWCMASLGEGHLSFCTGTACVNANCFKTAAYSVFWIADILTNIAQIKIFCSLRSYFRSCVHAYDYLDNNTWGVAAILIINCAPTHFLRKLARKRFFRKEIWRAVTLLLTVFICVTSAAFLSPLHVIPISLGYLNCTLYFSFRLRIFQKNKRHHYQFVDIPKCKNNVVISVFHFTPQIMTSEKLILVYYYYFVTSGIEIRRARTKQ